MTVLVCAHIFAYGVKASSNQQVRAEDETAIRKIIGRLQEGWNSGSGKAFAEPFAEDADYVVINGMFIKGRAAIEAGHQRIFDTIYKNSRINPSVQRIRLLGDGVAIAHIQWHLKTGEGAAQRERKAMNSMILIKKNDQWSIAAFQNTSVDSGQK